MFEKSSDMSDDETYTNACNLLYFKYGPNYKVHCFDSTTNDSTWNNVPRNRESENLPPLQMDLGSNFSDHASSSNDNDSNQGASGFSPKDDSEFSMDPDTSSDISPPTIFTKSRPVSRGNIARAPRHMLKNQCATSMRKRRGNLPKAVVLKMLEWLEKNRYCAYPSEVTKHEMSVNMGITVKQVSNWFINARRRKLNIILEEEGKCATDYRITRKKKGSAINRPRKSTSKTRLSSYQSTTSFSSDDPVPSEETLPTRPTRHISPSPITSPSPPSCSTSPTHSCSTSPIYESSTDESVFEFRPITPTERTLDFESL